MFLGSLIKLERVWNNTSVSVREEKLFFNGGGRIVRTLDAQFVLASDSFCVHKTLGSQKLKKFKKCCPHAVLMYLVVKQLRRWAVSKKKKKLFNPKLTTSPNKNYAKKTMDKEVYCAQCFIAD